MPVTKSSRSSRDTHKHDQLDQTLARHQGANSETLTPEQLVGASCEGAANDLTSKGAGNDPDAVTPCDTIVEKT